MEHKDHRETESPYEDLFLRFTRQAEKALTVLLFILLIALVVSQLLLQHPQIRYLLVRVERLEGNRYSQDAVSAGFSYGD